MQMSGGHLLAASLMAATLCFSPKVKMQSSPASLSVLRYQNSGDIHLDVLIFTWNKKTPDSMLQLCLRMW